MCDSLRHAPDAGLVPASDDKCLSAYSGESLAQWHRRLGLYGVDAAAMAD